jgi:hypothetical protein
MNTNTERRIAVIRTASITKTFFIPIPLIHGAIAKTNMVPTILRVTVIATMESETI